MTRHDNDEEPRSVRMQRARIEQQENAIYYSNPKLAALLGTKTDLTWQVNADRYISPSPLSREDTEKLLDTLADLSLVRKSDLVTRDDGLLIWGNGGQAEFDKWIPLFEVKKTDDGKFTVTIDCQALRDGYFDDMERNGTTRMQTAMRKLAKEAATHEVTAAAGHWSLPL